jgi:hypothetical protein
VGTGAGIGTISKWMSTPSTMSMNVLASIAAPGSLGDQTSEEVSPSRTTGETLGPCWRWLKGEPHLSSYNLGT